MDENHLPVEHAKCCGQLNIWPIKLTVTVNCTSGNNSSNTTAQVVKMRVLILVDCYPPSTKSGARMAYDLATGLCRKGHEVIVLTPSDTVSKQLHLSLEDGVRVARIKNGKIKDTVRAIRALREIRLSHSIWRRARRFLMGNPCDLIVFYSPTIFFAELVRSLKRQWGCPAYLILRDIFPQWAVDAGLLKKGIVWRYFRKKEIEQYETADRIGVQSPA